MQTKFKDIAQYYLSTGLEIRETRLIYPRSENIVILNFEHININFRTYKIKPLLRSLDSLTKPITVKGYNDDKEFVPYKQLGWGNGTQVIPTILADMINVYSFKLLLKLHFNIFNLEETEYIKID